MRNEFTICSCRERRLATRHSRRFQWVVHLTFAITVFSQIKPIQPVVRPLMYTLWSLLGVYSLIRRSGVIVLTRFTVLYIECYLGYVGLCLIASLLGGGYLNSTYLTAMLIPLFILVVADCTSDFSIDIIALGKTYIMSAVIFAIYVNITFFGSTPILVDGI